MPDHAQLTIYCQVAASPPPVNLVFLLLWHSKNYIDNLIATFVREINVANKTFNVKYQEIVFSLLKNYLVYKMQLNEFLQDFFYVRLLSWPQVILVDWNQGID